MYQEQFQDYGADLAGPAFLNPDLGQLLDQTEGLEQYVEAATAAYGILKSSKGGGKKTHEQRVAERQERVRARQERLGVTPGQWAELAKIARAKGYTYKTHKGRSVETVVQEMGGIDAVRDKFGWPDPATMTPDAAGGRALMTAGVGGGGVPWIPLLIIAGILVGPKLMRAR